ncbi:hypothetical protein M758_UG103300 [Ceratodon purpureus]|nr:hypothetical protein M758_UG103300 [Ceratodon purpureus]
MNRKTGRKMIVVDLGGYNIERHMEDNDVRVATGPHVRAVGSVGGHGYGWKKRQHNFSLPASVAAPRLAVQVEQQQGRGLEDVMEPEEAWGEHNKVDHKSGRLIVNFSPFAKIAQK